MDRIEPRTGGGAPDARPGETPATDPLPDCPICPRLAAFRAANRTAEPGWFNAPVPSWGPRDAPVLVVGMAPGIRGANRTGRPFTGDHAGWLLYRTLTEHGFARGRYAADPADGLVLAACRITNAVRCVPPQNLPKPVETRNCNPFLRAELAAMPRLRAILALGLLAHEAVLRAHALPLRTHRFTHGAFHPLPGGVLLADSYHVSRYNTSTGRLTEPMFNDVIARLAAVADGRKP